MAKRSEDVLLQIGAVRYKKGDGTLYVMNTRIGWMAENRDKVSVSVRFEDMKMQKISPEGKPKIQLQLVMNDGNNNTFHFVNENGTAAQIHDRDRVKELIIKLLPNFKPKVNKELEEKNRILSENPHLLQMYKDLVITQVLTSQEFWATNGKKYTDAQNIKKQDIGVSGAFLSEIKPQTDGANGLRYNLTPDVIGCIFKTYPAVERKYGEYVPGKMNESEFWTKFFQSHYFHRDRIVAGKDLFSECGKIDEQTIKKAVTQSAGDVLLDVGKFEDNTLEDGFGGSASDKSGVNSGNIVHQNMIRRFNQHSTMVLNTCTSRTEQDTNGSGHKEPMNGEKSSTTEDVVDGDAGPQTKRARIMEKCSYEDLGNGDETDATDESAPQLKLDKVERYLSGPPARTQSAVLRDNSFLSMDETLAKVKESIESWYTRTPQKILINPKAAVNALGELSPGGELMRGFQEQSLSQLVPVNIETECRNLYLALSELLRHFWSSFPPTTPELETKIVAMFEALQRFHDIKLKPFEEAVDRDAGQIGCTMTRHLNKMWKQSQEKYISWCRRTNRTK